MDEIKLSVGSSSVTVRLHGATVVSWVCDGVERLFVSSRSVNDGVKAIRGGIPVVFPQFGPWALGPNHGFARISRWRSDSVTDTKAVLVLEDSATTRAMWPHRFRLEYTVELCATSFEQRLAVHNVGDDPFSFTTLLHTYFRCDAVADCSVSGFKDCVFVDKTQDMKESTESRDTIDVKSYTDRIYRSTPNTHVLSGLAGKTTITLEKQNFADTVVWNPYEAVAATMGDLGADQCPYFVCVEAGTVADPITLTAGQSFCATQKFIAHL